MEAIEVNKGAENVVFIKVRLSAQITKDDSGGYVVYCPALDLCTQGQTLKEARHNIREAIELFIESCVERGTLQEVLAECGFCLAGEKSRRRRKPMPAVGTGRIFSVPAEIPFLTANC